MWRQQHNVETEREIARRCTTPPLGSGCANCYATILKAKSLRQSLNSLWKILFSLTTQPFDILLGESMHGVITPAISKPLAGRQHPLNSPLQKIQCSLLRDISGIGYTHLARGPDSQYKPSCTTALRELYLPQSRVCN